MLKTIHQEFILQKLSIRDPYSKAFDLKVHINRMYLKSSFGEIICEEELKFS